MSELEFATDVRSKNPDQNAHRNSRFRQGYRKGAAGESYGAKTLERLTWDNLGWRLGKLLGPAEEELVDELYEWCVRQQAGE